jgi:hypothetical protein
VRFFSRRQPRFSPEGTPLHAKQVARHFGTARTVLSLILLVVVIALFAVRAVGYTGPFRQPFMVLPTLPPVPVQPSSAAPVTVAPVTAAPPATAAPTPSAVPSGKVQPIRATTAPEPAKTSRLPVAGNGLVATLELRASWEQGYVADLRLVNNGSIPIAWRLTVSHSGQENLQLTAVWGTASGEQQGTVFDFEGGTLAAGASVMFGYQASKTGTGNAKPAGCALVGGGCGLG